MSTWISKGVDNILSDDEARWSRRYSISGNEIRRSDNTIALTVSGNTMRSMSGYVADFDGNAITKYGSIEYRFNGSIDKMTAALMLAIVEGL